MSPNVTFTTPIVPGAPQAVTQLRPARQYRRPASSLVHTYYNRILKAAFNQHQVVATCPLCNTDPEDRRHMILQCPALSKIRDKYLPRFVNLIPEFNYMDCDENIKIILDCTNAKCERASLEAVSRSYIYTAFTANGTSSLTAVAPERKGGKKLYHLWQTRTAENFDNLATQEFTLFYYYYLLGPILMKKLLKKRIILTVLLNS